MSNFQFPLFPFRYCFLNSILPAVFCVLQLAFGDSRHIANLVAGHGQAASAERRKNDGPHDTGCLPSLVADISSQPRQYRSASSVLTRRKNYPPTPFPKSHSSQLKTLFFATDETLHIARRACCSSSDANARILSPASLAFSFTNDPPQCNRFYCSSCHAKVRRFVSSRPHARPRLCHPFHPGRSVQRVLRPARRWPLLA